MQLTLSSIINTLLCANILFMFLFIVLKSKFILKYLSSYTTILCFLLIVIRFLFPYEFYFVKAIPIKNFLPQFYAFLSKKIINNDGYKITLIQCLSVIWGMGSIILFIKLVMDYFKTRNKLLGMSSVTDPCVLIAFRNINKKYDKKVTFTLVSSSSISTPLIFGIRSPVIALPQTYFTSKELFFIFEHELCHYYKKHLHIKLLCEILTVIYFWNPLVYIIKRQINYVLELYADARVNEKLPEYSKIEYLECLLKIAKNQQMNRRPFTCSIPFSITYSLGLSERGNILLNNYRQHNIPFFDRLLLISVFVLTLLSYSFICEPYTISKEYAENTYSLNEDNAYFVLNKNGAYDLYVNSEYKSTVAVIFDPSIPIKEN